MLLTIICTLLTSLSIIWLLLDIKYDWGTDLGAIVVVVLFGIWFVVNIICLFTCPAVTRSDISEFEAARITIQQQRENKLSEYERATLTKEIVDKNQWLAKEQFWAKSIWLNWYYDKKINNVKPIQ